MPALAKYYRVMSSSGNEPSVIRPQQAPRSVRVVNWPLRDGGWKAWGMLFALGLISAAAGGVAESGAMGGVCFVALATAAWRLWIPVTFDIRSRGVIYTVLGRSRQIPWTYIAGHEITRHGLRLFAEDKTAPWSVLRSLYIRWNGQRAAILEVVAFYSNTRVSVASTRTFSTESLDDSAE